MYVTRIYRPVIATYGRSRAHASPCPASAPFPRLTAALSSGGGRGGTPQTGRMRAGAQHTASNALGSATPSASSSPPPFPPPRAPSPGASLGSRLPSRSFVVMSAHIVPRYANPAPVSATPPHASTAAYAVAAQKAPRRAHEPSSSHICASRTADATKYAKHADPPERNNATNQRMLPSPMHVPTTGQWWSKRRTQWPHRAQWLARSGRQTRHVRQYRDASQRSENSGAPPSRRAGASRSSGLSKSAGTRTRMICPRKSREKRAYA